MTRAMGIGIFAAIVCAVGAGGATAALPTSSAAPAAQRALPAAARDPFGAELAQRLNALLSAALGPGQARISVNVVLDHSRSTTTRLQYSRRGAALPGQSASTRYTSGGVRYRTRSGTTTWARGARVTTTSVAPGAIRQIHLGLILSRTVPTRTAARLKRVIATAAGINRARGDTFAFTRARLAAPVAVSASVLSPGLRSGLATARWALLCAGVLAFLASAAAGMRRG